MNNHGRILSRVLTAEFYRVNAGFFLVITGFCFGFMRGPEHLALAGYFVSAPVLALIPVAVWIAYSLKVITYNRREVRMQQNYFLFSLPLLSKRVSIIYCLRIAWEQLAPATTYGLFLLLIAFRYDQYVPAVIICVAVFVLHGFVCHSLYRALLKPDYEKLTRSPVRMIDRAFAKPAAWMFAEGITRMQPGMIYGTKIVTCLLIYAVAQLYNHDTYDHRLYSMGACAAFAANIALVYQYQRFEVTGLLLLRSLPISFASRITTFGVTMIVICFPEIAILFTNLPAVLHVYDYLSVIAFGITLLLLAYGSLYMRDITFDDFTRWIFFVGLGWVLGILFGMPVLVGALVQGGIGVFLIVKYYYKFEVGAR